MSKTMQIRSKNRPILDILYDTDLHAVLKILDVQELDYAPPGILNAKGIPEKIMVNRWLNHRQTPFGRTKDREQSASLAETARFATLSDHYWLADPAKNETWEQINFFDNKWDDRLDTMDLQEPWRLQNGQECQLPSPCSTTDGDLPKQWIHNKKNRILLKGGAGPFLQQPVNEEIATALHKRIFHKKERFPYYVEYTSNGSLCACTSMAQSGMDFIPVWDLICAHKKPNHLNDFQHMIQCLNGAGIPLTEINGQLSRMFTGDAVLKNTDRHYRNFGILRDPDFPEKAYMAPVFDTGESLWCRQYRLKYNTGYSCMAKPFGTNGMPFEKQLWLFDDYKWFSEDMLKDFPEEAVEILRKNELLKDAPERFDRILHELQENIKEVCSTIHQIRPPEIPITDLSEKEPEISSVDTEYN